MIVVGIDPGAQGAIAFLDGDTGALLDVQDMPVDRIRIGKAERARVSVAGVLETFRGAAGADCRAFMERLSAMPASHPDPLTGARRTASPRSMLEFGRGGGVLEAALAACGIGLTIVEARTWKLAVRCPTGKDGARARAQQQFPAFARKFDRVKDDGRAESCLLGLYGVMLVGADLRSRAVMEVGVNTKERAVPCL